MKRIYISDLMKSLLIGFVIFFSGLASAAEISSDILGTVNVSGGSSAGYVVTVKNTRTGLTRQQTLGGDGSFRFASMPEGSYEITVKSQLTVVGQDTVVVSVGGNAVANFDIAAKSAMEEIVVVGSRARNIDLFSTDKGLAIGEQRIDSMPVGRDLTSVALLAPGVIRGDQGFGSPGANGFASFGGSSIAENSCYINGLEVTNTRQGLGCGSVPFEFYSDFQIKTGGYSPQFGRATGGVVNAVTKSGGNEWEYAVTAVFKPDSMRGDGGYSRANGGTGQVLHDEQDNFVDSSEYTFSASGPIIQDKLFIYVLANPRDTTQNFSNYSGRLRTSRETRFQERESSGGDNLFYGLKLDYYLNDYNTLSFFTYSDRTDQQETIYDRNADTRVIGTVNGNNIRKRGGEASALTYKGTFFDDLTLTVMQGGIETEYETELSNQTCPTVTDARPTPSAVSCGPGGQIGADFDDNTQTRLDLEYALGSHSLRFGYDYQDRQSEKIAAPAGGATYTYDTYNAGALIQGTNYYNPIQQDIVARRVFVGGGGFSSELTAYYLEDSWSLTDTLVLNIGARKDAFVNTGTTGVDFVDLETDWAPRFGVSWDPTGDAKYKVTGTWGRYYLPVPNNTNYRAASGVSDITTHSTFDSINPVDGTPVNPVVRATTVSSVPVAPSVATFQSEEAEPFYKEELILGFEASLTDTLTASVKFISRDVGSALDDYCGDLLVAPSLRNDPDQVGHFCALFNPGKSATWQRDEDLDGIPDPGTRTTYTPEEIGFPEAVNEYRAIQPGLEYKSDNLRWNLLYSWSTSYGNFEGAVKSDILQPDAGVTQDFDFPALADGALGYQANDRRHVIKFYGDYDMSDKVNFGINAFLASGKPLSAYGRGYPDPSLHLYGSYGDTFYLTNCPTAAIGGAPNCGDATQNTYTKIPKGSVGRTSWLFNIDVSAGYHFVVSGFEVKAAIDIFNILDNSSVFSQNEHYEITPGSVSQFYGGAYTWQEPRSVRIGLEARF